MQYDEETKMCYGQLKKAVENLAGEEKLLETQLNLHKILIEELVAGRDKLRNAVKR